MAWHGLCPWHANSMRQPCYTYAIVQLCIIKLIMCLQKKTVGSPSVAKIAIVSALFQYCMYHDNNEQCVQTLNDIDQIPSQLHLT